jgi:glycosyltransferase involved in cell wall biosynthesis
MPSDRKSILYTYVQQRSFVTTDLTRLQESFAVSSYKFAANKKFLLPFYFLLQAGYLLMFGWRYNAFACFFAGFHSMLPSWFARLTGKKCIIFLGGTDCFKYPSFRYGNFTKAFYGYATCFSAHKASLLVPVSATLMRTTSSYYEVDSVTQGIYHWCKNLDTPYYVVATEYDPETFKRMPVDRIPNSFITIGFDIQGTSFMRKGIDKFLMMAANFPEYSFTIVGSAPEQFPVQVPSNVTLVPPVPHAEIPVYLSRHQFYVQLSIAEGLPNAVCEAMLCECIPIGSEANGIPDAIGSFGFLVPKRNDETIIKIVREAIAYPEKETMGKKGRQHIISRYGPGTRVNELVKLFS